MKNKITSLEIKNFKSIKNIKIKPKRINIFIGKPNVGKSNLLEALSLFCAPHVFDQDYKKFLLDFIRYNTVNNFFYDNDLRNSIEVNTNVATAYLRYYIGQVDQYDLIIGDPKDLGQGFKSKKSINAIAQEVERLQAEYLSTKGEHKKMMPFYYTMQQSGQAFKHTKMLVPSRHYISPVKKYHFKNPDDHSNKFDFFLLPPYGQNIFTILEYNKSLREQAKRFFKEFDLSFVYDVEKHSFEIQKKVHDDIYKYPYNLVADTLQRMIFHLAAIESNVDSVILFEEPEAHSFPPYISMLAERIIMDKKNQYFINTHSPYVLTPFIEQTDYKDVAIFITTYHNWQTKVKELTAKQLEMIMDKGIEVFYNLNLFEND